MQWDVRRVDETASTNADVSAAAREGAPAGVVIVAEHQTAGRGRLDRSWEAAPGSGLAMSVLLRPERLPADMWPWIPLVAGLAVADAVRTLGRDVALKWPNDVELDGYKLAGLLVERVETPTGPAAVVGIGLNVAMTAEQLPVPTATSLHLAGVEASRDDVLTAVLDALDTRLLLLDESSPAMLRAAYVEVCGTIGGHVEVSLPDGSTLAGVAEDVDEFGRLVVDGQPVTAGDVLNVRR